MNVGAWITAQQATPSASNHHQPGRLVRGGQQRAWGPSADRLTSLEGLGNLAALGSEDESMGTDEEAEAAAEKDTDWVGLVKGLATALSPVAKEAVKGAFAQSKLNQGWTGDMISRYLGMGETRAAGVNAGTASMPTAGWIGIGVAVVAVLGMMFFMMSGRRSNPFTVTGDGWMKHGQRTLALLDDGRPMRRVRGRMPSNAKRARKAAQRARLRRGHRATKKVR